MKKATGSQGQTDNQDKRYFVIRNTNGGEVEDDDDGFNENVEELRANTSSAHSSLRPQRSVGLLSSSQRKLPSRENIVPPVGTETPKSITNQRQASSSQLQSRNSHRETISNSRFDLQRESNPQLIGEGRIGEYGEEEENIICARFPHLNFCACETDCNISTKEVNLLEVVPGIFLGGFTHGLCVKKMLLKGITHILNVTAQEYRKRTKYFSYLNIDVYNKSDEDIKKHFRITNRFIKDCVSAGGKVLIQDISGINIGPCFTLAYFICNEKIPLKIGQEMLQEKTQLQIAPNFMKQLERYDLEKLAQISTNKKKPAP